MFDICLFFLIMIVTLVMLARRVVMRTVSIFKNGKNQAVRLPKDFEFDGTSELEIYKQGDVITLRPVRPDWLSFSEQGKATDDFMGQREDVIKDEERFNFE